MTADAKTKLVSNEAGDAAGEKATLKAGAVYDTLQRRILDGVYPPGDWLRLSQLARDFSVSEMPIREALRLLQKDGFVVLQPASSARKLPNFFGSRLRKRGDPIVPGKGGSIGRCAVPYPGIARVMAVSVRTMRP
jgi:DNA-binding transcriptional MocR family regulator